MDKVKKANQYLLENKDKVKLRWIKGLRIKVCKPFVVVENNKMIQFK